MWTRAIKKFTWSILEYFVPFALIIFSFLEHACQVLISQSWRSFIWYVHKQNFLHKISYPLIGTRTFVYHGKKCQFFGNFTQVRTGWSIYKFWFSIININFCEFVIKFLPKHVTWKVFIMIFGFCFLQKTVKTETTISWKSGITVSMVMVFWKQRGRFC